MPLALAPVAFVARSIRTHIHPVAMLFSVLVVSVVVVAVGPGVFALAMRHSVFEVSFVPA